MEGGLPAAFMIYQAILISCLAARLVSDLPKRLFVIPQEARVSLVTDCLSC